MKKKSIMVITLLLSIANIGCLNMSNIEEKRRIATQQQIDNQNPYSLKNIVGTYEIKDITDKCWILTLNPDKTATMELPSRNAITYASWHNYDDYDDEYISIEYSTSGVPAIWFPFGESGAYGSSNFIKDGYFYYGFKDREAKNPEARLPIKKIK